MYRVIVLYKIPFQAVFSRIGKTKFVKNLDKYQPKIKIEKPMEN